jgi:predicted transposase/invertase (TIGR01784 family)
VEGSKMVAKNGKNSQITSDALFKKIMGEKVAATEFLEEYLPKSLKDRVDLSSIKIEKESFVEDDLKRRLSDVVYSLKTKDNEEVFTYILIESQSSPDYWIALRLMQYSLLLLERHKKGRNKLPIIWSAVVYNGTKPYAAPLSFWDLFNDPSLAKKAMAGPYKLIDLSSMEGSWLRRDGLFRMFFL